MFVSSTYRITGFHYTYGSAILSAAYVSYLYVENDRVTLQLLVCHLKQNLCWLPLTFRFNLEVSSVKCSLLLLVYLKNHWITLLFWVPHLNFSRTYRINKLHNTNGNVTLRADCVGYLCFQNLKSSLLKKQSVQLKKQPTFVSSTHRITGVHYKYG